MKARKRFGQHFLEGSWIDKVVRAIAPRAGDVMIEIGPGRGALTSPLARAVGQLIAVEIDRDLVARLTALDLPRVTVVSSDILEITPARLRGILASAGVDPATPIRVAGNLPYNVASPILFALADLRAAGLPVTDATFMIQREVADRLTARPNSGDYGVLSVLVQLEARVERLLELPPGAFRPPPKVRSTVVRLTFHPPEPRPADLPAFTRLVRDVFTRRRKTLANALLAHGAVDPGTAAAALSAAGIDGRRRPETLDLQEFVRLSDSLASVPKVAATANRLPVL